MRLAWILVGCLAACSSKSADGLPPASDWSDNTDPSTIAPPQDPARPQAPSDDMPDDETHRGFAAGEVDIDEADPAHINVDPDVPSDPATRVRGTLRVAKGLAGRIQPDGIIYLMAKTPDASGQPTGTAMAVDRLIWKADGQAFELGGATGEVLVIARYDQDGEGASPQPGDVVGMTRVKVPADNVVIELSTVLP